MDETQTGRQDLNTNQSLNGVMCLPILISIQDVIIFLQNSLPGGDHLNFVTVIKAMLENVFYSETAAFGEYNKKMLDAYKKLQEINSLNDIDIEYILKEAQAELEDCLETVMPGFKVLMINYHYRYPDGENQPNLYIFVPMDLARCPDDFKKKLVPLQDARYAEW